MRLFGHGSTDNFGTPAPPSRPAFLLFCPFAPAFPASLSSLLLFLAQSASEQADYESPAVV